MEVVPWDGGVVEGLSRRFSQAFDLVSLGTNQGPWTRYLGTHQDSVAASRLQFGRLDGWDSC